MMLRIRNKDDAFFYGSCRITIYWVSKTFHFCDAQYSAKLRCFEV